MVTSVQLDHVLIAVDDLDAAEARMRNRHGLAVAGGGRHPGWGTANRIVPLGDCYLELIAVVDELEAQESPFGRWVGAATRGGPLGWAVRTDDLDATAARLGVTPRPGVRQTADGRWIRWRMAGTDEAVAEPALPFFIEWEPGSRLPGQLTAPHRRRVEGVSRVVVTGDSARVSRWLGPHALPIEVIPGAPGIATVVVAAADGEVVIESDW